LKAVLRAYLDLHIGDRLRQTIVFTEILGLKPPKILMTATISARDLFRAAYENRYTWDRGFPGFTADVTFTHNDATFNGQVRVNADLTAQVNGIDDKDAADTVKNQLREVAIHRIRRTFEETHGKNEFEYGEPATDGSTEILVGGKSSGDRYRVKDNIVTLVHRHIR
jgi:hypothetical protein